MDECAPKARRNGRDARRAARQGPLPDAQRPIRPGMMGGRFLPLSEADVLAIHRTALRLLSEVGLADATPTGLQYLTSVGCTISEWSSVVPRVPR